MRAVVQRVSSANVKVDKEIIGQVERGFLILVCAMRGDTLVNADQLAAKISKLRVFKDEDGRMNKSVLDVNGAALVVSQFTLAADTARGNRPGFSAAAPPELGEELYERFCAALAELSVPVQTGKFGADMEVGLLNDGPVTIIMDV